MYRSKVKRRILLSVRSICVLLLLLLGGDAAHASYAAYRDYRDIPGVTSDDVAAVEKIKASRDSFVYGAGGSNETFLADGDGSVGGFSRLLCDWLSELFGIPFRPSIYRLADLSGSMEAGTVDFTCEFAPTPERQQLMPMTGTIVRRPVTRFRMTDSEPLSAVSVQRPLRYGFVEWYQTADLVGATVSEPFEAFLYTRREDAIAALRSGEIDAFVMDMRGEAAFNRFDDVRQEVFFPLMYSNASLATPDPALAPIVDVVQKFLETEGARPFLSDMYERGEREFLRNNFRSMLTVVEKQYVDKRVANGVAIPFAAERRNYPTSFYNHRDRELQGIAIDILREISALSGLTFTPVDPGVAKWADLRALFDSGEAALITELIYTRHRRDAYLWADAPYDVQRYALLSRFDTPTVTFDRISAMRVGTIRASAFEDVFRDLFPDHANLTLYDGSEEAFDALGAGEIDLFMASGNRLLYAANYLERPDFKLNFEFDRLCESSFGFARDQQLLCGIVGKAQRIVDTDKIAQDWKQRAFDYRRRMLEEQIPYYISFAACLFLATGGALYLFAVNERIKRGLAETVARRTGELQLQTAAAQSASREKSEFLARMSHELRTPLNAVAGMANIAGSTDDMRRSDESAEKIERAAEQLRDIFDNALELSGVETTDVPEAKK